MRASPLRRISNRTALFWSSIETFSHQGIQLVVYIILARLVSPHDFGLVAMLAVFLAVAQSLSDSGFGNALIQKQDDDDIDRSTVFYFNLGVGITLSSVIYLSSGFIAGFYAEPALEPLTKVMSLVVLAASIGLIQDALTRKQLDFRTRAKAAVIASVAAAAVSIPMAASGAGVWALAAQMIVMRVMQSALLWAFCKWRPSLAFSITRLRSMFGFGFKLLIAGLLGAFFNNFYAMVIGRVYAPVDVGFYSNAKRYQEYPANNLTRIFSRFTFPAFSREQDDLARFQALFAKSLHASCLAVFPALGMLAGIAHPLFETVLGAKWLPSVPLFQVLCIAGLFQPIASVNLNCLLATGRSGHFLLLEIVKRLLFVIALALTFSYGVFWIVVGEAVTCVICYFVNTFFTQRILSISSLQQLRLLGRITAMTAVVGVSAYLGTMVQLAPVGQLISGVATGGIAGAAFMVCFDRSSLSMIVGTVNRFRSGATAASGPDA
ncbi:MAG: lipopolysaccharide biosynthesis protein [Pseudomonadales bacterium]